MPTAALNFSATVTASWPVMASTTSSTWCGPTVLLDRPQLVEHRLVDVQPPRGVEDERRQARAAPPRRAPRAQMSTGLLAGLADDGDAELRAERAELVDGGGPVDVGGGQERMLALLLEVAGQLGGAWSSCRSPAGRSA